jgi:hypothetical protein
MPIGLYQITHKVAQEDWLCAENLKLAMTDPKSSISPDLIISVTQLEEDDEKVDYRLLWKTLENYIKTAHQIMEDHGQLTSAAVISGVVLKMAALQQEAMKEPPKDASDHLPR